MVIVGFTIETPCACGLSLSMTVTGSVSSKCSVTFKHFICINPSIKLNDRIFSIVDGNIVMNMHIQKRSKCVQKHSRATIEYKHACIVELAHTINMINKIEIDLYRFIQP